MTHAPVFGSGDVNKPVSMTTEQTSTTSTQQTVKAVQSRVRRFEEKLRKGLKRSCCSFSLVFTGIKQRWSDFTSSDSNTKSLLRASFWTRRHRDAPCHLTFYQTSEKCQTSCFLKERRSIKREKRDLKIISRDVKETAQLAHTHTHTAVCVCVCVCV